MTNLIGTIVAIRALSKSIYGEPSPFHLARCGGCMGPSFGQPCALCDYYPMGERYLAPEKPRFTCEGFEKRISVTGADGPNGRPGNIATWYARYFCRVVAYKNGGIFKQKTDRFIADSQDLAGLASAAEIYQAVTVENRTLSAPYETTAFQRSLSKRNPPPDADETEA